MHDNIFFEECILMIERKLDWGSSSQWTAYHFNRLSEEIFGKTGKTISDSTLKRFFGKKDAKENYNPQLYTKNALAEFLGFKDWQDLISYIKSTINQVNIPDTAGKKRIPVLLLSSIVIIIGVAIFLTSGGHNETAWFKCADTNRLVPFTAVFHYDVSNINDSVFIDFGNSTRVPLPRGKHTITEFYKSAGIFYPKIFTNKRLIDSICLRNDCRDWLGGYSPNDSYNKFIPFEDSLIYRQNGRLYVPPAKIILKDPVYNNGYYTEYRLVRNFNISLDSVEFNATIKNPANEGGRLCYDAEIWLVGTKNVCKVRFVEPGCFRYGQLQISEKIYNGRFDDLSALAHNLGQWRNISVKIKNFQTEIFFEEKPVMKEEYKNPLGKLTGLYFRFYGTGSVKSVALNDIFGKSVYFEDFKSKYE